MKKLFILVATLVALTATAQTTREEIDLYPQLVISSQTLYAADIFSKPLAEAPKGYTPFYISHYGRHGSRYEAHAEYNENVCNYFSIAESLGILTPQGKEVKAILDGIRDVQIGRFGDLTQLGKEQHRTIAERMYNRFKSVFAKGAIVDSRSSVRTRCVVSMTAFNDKLKECQPQLKMQFEASDADAKIIRPMASGISPYSYYEREASEQEWQRIYAEWRSKCDFSHSINLLFTDIQPLCERTGMDATALMADIYKRWAFMQNFGMTDRSKIEAIFNAEERHTVYKHDNYRWFCLFSGTSLPDSNRYFATMKWLTDDIIERAEGAIAGTNNHAADLRFGHDYFILGLLAVLQPVGMGFDSDYHDVDKLAESWRGYRIVSMASNTQFILYRSKKSSDILVRILHNESDITLPIESATAPFYKWEDLRNYINQRVEVLSKY